MGKRLDLVGQKFNRLEVIEFAYIDKWHHSCWRCICVCGNEVIVVGKEITSGRTKSCGCLKIELLIKRCKGRKLSKETRANISKALTGGKLSKETRKRMSESKKGIKFSEEHKRNMSEAWKKRAPMSEETKKKMSENHADMNGKNNPNYKPHLTDEDRQSVRNIPGYVEWRKAVYERDDYTCQVCGSKKSGNIVAHHLESYNSNPKLRTTLSNGITLCEDKCHKDFHHQYGYGNNTRKQFEKFKKEHK